MLFNILLTSILNVDSLIIIKLKSINSMLITIIETIWTIKLYKQKFILFSTWFFYEKELNNKWNQYFQYILQTKLIRTKFLNFLLSLKKKFAMFLRFSTRSKLQKWIIYYLRQKISTINYIVKFQKKNLI